MTLGKQHPVIQAAQALVKEAYCNPDIEEGIYVNVYQEDGTTFIRFHTLGFDADEDDAIEPLCVFDLGPMSFPNATYFVQQVAGLLNLEYDGAGHWLPYRRTDYAGLTGEEGFATSYKGDVSEVDDTTCWLAHGPGLVMHMIDTMGSLCGDEIDVDLQIWPMPSSAVGDTFSRSWPVTFAGGRPVCPACLDIHRTRLSP